MASRIIRPVTAFTGTGSAKKRPRVVAKPHLDFIRSLPCLITGKRPVEAAHLRYADLRYGKASVGMGEKPDDRWTVPLCPEMHREQHSENEQQWWRSKGVDPMPVALALWGCTGDEEQGETVIRLLRERATP